MNINNLSYVESPIDVEAHQEIERLSQRARTLIETSLEPITNPVVVLEDFPWSGDTEARRKSLLLTLGHEDLAGDVYKRSLITHEENFEIHEWPIGRIKGTSSRLFYRESPTTEGITIEFGVDISKNDAERIQNRYNKRQKELSERISRAGRVCDFIFRTGKIQL